MSTGFLQRHDNIYLYIPNLIGTICLIHARINSLLHFTGYLRIVLSLTSFAVARTDPATSFLFYFLRCDVPTQQCRGMHNQPSALSVTNSMAVLPGFSTSSQPWARCWTWSLTGWLHWWHCTVAGHRRCPTGCPPRACCACYACSTHACICSSWACYSLTFSATGFKHMPL